MDRLRYLLPLGGGRSAEKLKRFITCKPSSMAHKFGRGMTHELVVVDFSMPRTNGWIRYLWMTPLAQGIPNRSRMKKRKECEIGNMVRLCTHPANPPLGRQITHAVSTVSPFTSLPSAHDLGGENPYIDTKDVLKLLNCGRLGR
jgi:hypothetical protein